MEVAVIAVLIFIIGLGAMFWFLRKEMIKHWSEDKPIVQPVPQVTVNLQSLEDKMADLPNKVLQSITNSANTHKGALGELIGYINLRSSYDRIVPLGNIVDFLAIKFPKDGKDGKLVFIDVKTGKSARLSKDQMVFRKLIEEKRIEFMKLTIKELKETIDEPEGIPEGISPKE